MGFVLIAKMTAARTRTRGFHGLYRGPNLSLFRQTGVYIRVDFGHRDRAIFWGLFDRKREIFGDFATTEKGIPADGTVLQG
jgi:hypothetical protein